MIRHLPLTTHNQSASVSGVTQEIALAATGRSKCRGCRQSIAKGELRFGEQVANAFGDGDATYWFHLPCAAVRRPEAFLTALQEHTAVEQADALRKIAELGVQYPKLCEIVGAERSPTARARCRVCREIIDKDALRLALERLQDGMTNAAGFVHAGCAGRFVLGDEVSEPPADLFSGLVSRLRQLPSKLSEADFVELESLLQ